MRRTVREALAAGWRWDGFSGTTHARIVWPETGDRLSFGTTPSVASWKSLANDIKKVSGVETWRKGNRKRSRKAIEVAGYNKTYRSASAEAVSTEVEALRNEWREIEGYLIAAVSTGRRPDDGLEKAIRRQEIADRLRDLYQPVPASAFPIEESA
jgi:hypothetical protein